MAMAQTIIDSVKDIYSSLPLLFIGFSFLFGILTSNTGLIWLFIGQALYVPAVTTFTNQSFDSIFKNPFEGILTSFSVLFPFLISLYNFIIQSVFGAIDNVTGGETNYLTLFFTSLLPALINIILLGASQVLVNKSPSPSTDTTCSLLPSKKEDISWSTPSAWTAQIVFITSYILANAMTLFTEPTPTAVDIQGINDPTEKEKAIKTQQEMINQKVYNRKFHAVWIMLATSLTLLFLLFIRYNKTMCEGGFMRSLIPLFTLSSSGFVWYNFVYNSCGVRPVDILGIMTNMGDQMMSQNPIICTGQTS